MNEKFYSDIYDIVYDRSIHKKYLSIKDLKTIVAIYNRSFYTHRYAEGVIGVSFSNPKKYGSYTPSSKIIKIDDIKICKNTNLEGYYGKNIAILQTLLHELQHAYQIKRINESKFVYNDYKDIELFLLLYSYFFLKYTNPDKRLGEKDIEIITNLGVNPNSSTIASDIKDILSNYYRYNPAERMAEIKSLYLVRNMLSIFDNKSESIEKVDNRLSKEIVRGYYKGQRDLCYNSPSITFLRELQLPNEIRTLNDMIYAYKDQLTDSKRLYLGIHTDDQLVRRLINKNKSGE